MQTQGYTRHAEAVCTELRQNIAQRSAQLRARVAPAQRKTKPRNVKGGKPKVKAKPKAKGPGKRGAAAAKEASATEAAPEEDEEGGDGDAAASPKRAMKVEEEEVAQQQQQEQDEDEDDEEDEEEAKTGGTAKVALSIEGGPYDGSVFEITVEEDGDARLIGRSTGKKVRSSFHVFACVLGRKGTGRKQSEGGGS